MSGVRRELDRASSGWLVAECKGPLSTFTRRQCAPRHRKTTSRMSFASALRRHASGSSRSRIIDTRSILTLRCQKPSIARPFSTSRPPRFPPPPQAGPTVSPSSLPRTSHAQRYQNEYQARNRALLMYTTAVVSSNKRASAAHTDHSRRSYSSAAPPMQLCPCIERFAPRLGIMAPR